MKRRRAAGHGGTAKRRKANDGSTLKQHTQKEEEEQGQEEEPEQELKVEESDEAKFVACSSEQNKESAKQVIEVSEASVLHFRLLRAGLLQGHQFSSVEEAARSACGIQAQELQSALLALRARVKPGILPPTLEECEKVLFAGPDPPLVRIYAQVILKQ